jgi:uncharacterized protein YuzB (UPF0349 family)
MAAGYYSRYLQNIHGTCSEDLSPATAEEVNGTPAAYTVSAPPYSSSVNCLVEGCPGRAKNKGHFHRQFMFKHPEENTVILEEGILSHCKLCDMFVSNYALIGGHRETVLCKQGEELKNNRTTKEDSQRA